MITNHDISAVKLSPTNKDFAQIWTELIDVASKISTRWDPVSTNESDPGIVLLKVLVGIADMLNYNIDKNILEAYMPSAAQIESMRMLCNMLGYNMKLYRSAETTLTLDYTKAGEGNTPDHDTDPGYALPELGLSLPRFTVFYNDNKDVFYTSTNSSPIIITNNDHQVRVPCIEGQVVQCESLNENNVITLDNFTDDFRYYLPEVQIAENGIFVYNVKVDPTTGDLLSTNEAWARVENLNSMPQEAKCFKVGFDSVLGLPYIEFNNDVSNILEDGLFVYYTRTSGANGNISANTITQFDAPTEDYWSGYSLEHFTVTNPKAATNGTNPETITEAFNGYKKVIGTFDTLVTCRDYMNKIYSLMDEDNNPYVSNINVTDVNSDINNAVTICSCTNGGILYKARSLSIEVDNSRNTTVGLTVDGLPENTYRANIYNYPGNSVKDVPLLNNFELVLYPFNTFSQVSRKTSGIVDKYNKSFTYTEPEIDGVAFTTALSGLLSDVKTLAHTFRLPETGDIVSINNYLRLDAVVSTVNKVTRNEASSILANIKIALANKFNMRNIDFGEEIPYDEILETIENADARIRVVSLQDPTSRVYTKFAVKQNENSIVEYFVDSEVAVECEPTNNLLPFDRELADRLYNKLAVRNILAGRVPLFKINESFSTSFDEAAYVKRNQIDINSLPSELQSQLKAAVKALGTITEPGYFPLIDANTGLAITASGIEAVHDGATFEYHTFYDNNTSVILASEYIEVYEPYESIFDNVTNIEIETEIPSEDGEIADIPLEDGENIEFSAPNFVTTMTYPAYVYYNFVSQHRESESTAEYATAVSLIDAMHSVGDNSADKNIDKKGARFFANLWKDASAAGVLKEFYIINSDKKDKDAATTWEEESLDLNEYLNDALRSSYRIGTVAFTKSDTSWFDGLTDSVLGVGSLGAKTAGFLLETLLGIKTKPSAVADVEYNSFTTVQGIMDYLEAVKDKTDGKKIRFFHVPLQESTMQFWRNQLNKASRNELIGSDFRPFDGDSTVLWRISGSGNVPGKYILETGAKALPQESKYFTNTSERFQETYLITYPGKDPASYAIPKDSDYQLRPGEKLYIHYTPSKTDNEGNSVTSEPINKIYASPTIIRPVGFDLHDTKLLYDRGGISWKKENVEFPGGGMNLMSLGGSEQIEIREQSSVTIDATTTKIANIYTNFDPEEKFVEVNSDSTAQVNATALTEEDSTTKKVKKYTLQDNEYFFYTDQNKASIAYYGSGSEIVLYGLTLPSMEKISDTDALLSDSLQDVPFKAIDFTKLTNASIIINENQFYTLVGGDTLKSLKLKSAKSLTKTPTECINDATSAITFQRAGEEEVTKLPRIDLMGASWKVACKTALLTSPVTVQTIRSDSDKIKNIIKITNISATDEENAEAVAKTVEIEPEPNNPISLRTNKVVQAANGSATFKSTDGLSLKIFSEGNSTLADSKATAMQTPSGTFTKFNLTDLANSGSVKLSAAIPDNHFGIFSIITHSEAPKLDGLRTLAGRPIDFAKSGSRAYIEIPLGMKNHVSLVNYECIGAGMASGQSINDWWAVSIPKDSSEHALYESNPATTSLPEYYSCAQAPGDTPSTYKLFLRNGLNCIRINKSMTFNIKAEGYAEGTLAIDTLKLVDAFTVINQEQLQYRADGNMSEAETLFRDLREIDRDYDFYYSLAVENTLGIDFNSSAHESLATPNILYDVNNINRNFVVSKIDFDYLNKATETAQNNNAVYTAGGIRIARSSILS